jgi:signal transduction histidine kinase
MQTAINFSKQFVAWGTALQARYESDLYFRTSVNIIALQVGFVLVCTGAFALALLYPFKGWIILGVIVVIALACGVLLSKFTLQPARDTARYQKLFISNIAHELRTPLSTIKTSSEVALIDDSLDPDARKTFLEIIEELNRISEIINNLLSLNTLTRPERMQFSNIDLMSLAERVVARHLPLAKERGVKVTVRNEPGAIVWGNATALEQLMTNLVKNALSYTPEDTHGTVTITVRPAEAGMILFAVADTGIGMTQEELNHVFEPFYRADTSRNRDVKKTGAGLGLTIVNEMVRAHRGRIHIDSGKRKGTTVSVYLPRGGAGSGKTSAEPDRNTTTADFTSGTPIYH